MEAMLVQLGTDSSIAALSLSAVNADSLRKEHMSLRPWKWECFFLLSECANPIFRMKLLKNNHMEARQHATKKVPQFLPHQV